MCHRPLTSLIQNTPTPYEEQSRDMLNSFSTKCDKKVACTSGSANILLSIENDEPLLAQLRSETTFMLSTDASATSITVLPIDLDNSKPIEEHNACESPLLDSTWVIAGDASASEEFMTVFTTKVEERPTLNSRVYF